MTFTHLKTLVVLAAVLASDLAAQRMSPQSAAQVITRVADELERGYVFPQAGRLMADSLRSRVSRGEYASELELNTLAARLTADLRGLSNDRHLSIRPPVSSAPPATAATPARQREESRAGVVVLPDSIGYLKIVAFDEQLRSTLPDHMGKVTSLKAFIIDIRESPGGGAEPFLALAGYLLPQRTRLGNLYSRLDDSTIEMWTEEPKGPRYSGPVFVLTAQRTFSAAEAFAYHLKALGRVTVVGDTTGGGAHRIRGVDLGQGMMMALPYTRVINAVTGTDWEGTGVTPHVPADSAQALDAALRLIRRSGGRS